AKDMLADAHMKARAAILNVFSPLVGQEVPMQAPVPKLDGTPGAVVSAGPSLGQDTGAILEALGYSADDQVRLRDEHVI
ncbi:MAG: CoA transferase, partial [Pseudomonadota bacterium]